MHTLNSVQQTILGWIKSYSDVHQKKLDFISKISVLDQKLSGSPLGNNFSKVLISSKKWKLKDEIKIRENLELFLKKTGLKENEFDFIVSCCNNINPISALGREIEETQLKNMLTAKDKIVRLIEFKNKNKERIQKRNPALLKQFDELDALSSILSHSSFRKPSVLKVLKTQIEALDSGNVDLFSKNLKKEIELSKKFESFGLKSEQELNKAWNRIIKPKNIGFNLRTPSFAMILFLAFAVNIGASLLHIDSLSTPLHAQTVVSSSNSIDIDSRIPIIFVDVYMEDSATLEYLNANIANNLFSKVTQSRSDALLYVAIGEASFHAEPSSPNRMNENKRVAQKMYYSGTESDFYYQIKKLKEITDKISQQGDYLVSFIVHKHLFKHLSHNISYLNNKMNQAGLTSGNVVFYVQSDQDIGPLNGYKTYKVDIKTGVKKLAGSVTVEKKTYDQIDKQAIVKRFVEELTQGKMNSAQFGFKLGGNVVIGSMGSSKQENKRSIHFYKFADESKDLGITPGMKSVEIFTVNQRLPNGRTVTVTFEVLSQ